MPMNTVLLRPGVNTQKTLALNEAGVSESNLIRYQGQITQKIGGWELYYPLAFGSTIKEIHPWQDAAGTQHLAVGTTGSSVSGGALNIITDGSNSDISPETRTSNPAPNFSVSAGSNIITIVDPGSSASTYDTVFLNTPVAIGGTFISGAYSIYTVGGSSSYTILSSANSSSTVTSSGILAHFATTAGSAQVTVTLPNNNYLAVNGLFYPFYAATTVDGLVIQGGYQVNVVLDSTTFTIIAPTQASSTNTATMNSSLAQIVYYTAAGPPALGGGYGLGGYGLGGYGVGSTPTSAGGTPINATDWTMDNWGEVLLACPTDGPIYQWSPDGGFTTATVIPEAPFFNGGIFISQPQQILVCWRSTLSTGVQDALKVRWCNAGDYTNWVVSSQTTAGSFQIPTGSKIIGGLQGPTQAMIWTDVDAWVMQYVGGDVIFNFTRVGTGCGLVGPHAASIIGGEFYWMSPNNFYKLGGGGVQVLPCTVWDFIFQNLDTDNIHKVRCAANSTFNEISWFFPVTGGDGENGAYVKYNVLENEWDYGILGRNAWWDISILGNPLGADTMYVYQHEETENAAGQPINGLFTSGYWTIAQGNELAFVDWILPDMKFGTYSGNKTATCEVTFLVTDYAGDTPREYGPYTFTNATQYINVRFRGRFMAIRVESNDLNSFWRLGAVKYRFAPSGRR